MARHRPGRHFFACSTNPKSPVHGPLGQADGALYRKAVADLLSEQENLQIIEGAVASFLITDDTVTGLTTEAGEILIIVAPLS